MSKVDQRDALEVLTRARLIELGQGFGLAVTTRSCKDELIEVLARSKRARYEAILGQLRRSELKDVCRAHGLSDRGRSKAEIIDRILGREVSERAGAAAASRASSSRRARGAGVQPRARARRSGRASTSTGVELPVDRRLTVAEFERYLWSAADILRGSIDSSDYKHYIFGLLFLKRLSDRFEEEQQRDVDAHQFFVPPRARWARIAEVRTRVGEALNVACMALEDANPEALEGVLAGIDYDDPNRLGDIRSRDQVLGRLIEHFSKLRLRNADLSEPDMLGRAYEYLIERFADDAGKKGGEFYTPNMVVRLIVELLDPVEGMRICDPTCGSGGMLVQCAEHVERTGGDPQNLTLHGQEKNLGTWAICRMNMLLHGRASARIEKGDTIRDPRLLEGGRLVRYDRVIANPPFSLDKWGREVAEHDRHGRFRFGLPPKSRGDMAFIQHMVATLADRGKMAVVMPHGVLFRGSAEGRIREAMVREDLFEAIVGLPPNLFYGTGIPATVLVLARDKPRRRRHKVLLVDASGQYREGSNQNSLRPQDVARIAGTVARFEDVERYARLVGIDELAANEFNLNISRYVDTSVEEERVDLKAAVRRLRELDEERAEAEVQMDALLVQLGLGPGS